MARCLYWMKISWTKRRKHRSRFRTGKGDYRFFHSSIDCTNESYQGSASGLPRIYVDHSSMWRCHLRNHSAIICLSLSHEVSWPMLKASFCFSCVQRWWIQISSIGFLLLSKGDQSWIFAVFFLFYFNRLFSFTIIHFLIVCFAGLRNDHYWLKPEHWGSEKFASCHQSTYDEHTGTMSY